MFNDLNEFIAASVASASWRVVTEPVSPDLEIAAVTDRVSKSPGGGPALLFERPTGFDIPVAVNLFGSMKRMCMALGVATLDDLAREIDELATPKMPSGCWTRVQDAAQVEPPARSDAQDGQRCAVPGSRAHERFARGVARS